MHPDNPFYKWLNELVKHTPETILKHLDILILYDGGLFVNDPSYMELRSLSLNFKINLLIEWQRYGEALAWLCLETEINPTNFKAQALKEQLKKKLSFSTLDNVVSVKPKSNAPLFDWGPVAGMRREKTILERDILLPLKESKIYNTFNATIPRGLLLYGPPGCGKTFIVKQLAKLLNYNYVEVSPSSLASIYVHGTQEKIKSLFEEAIKKKPSILFFDEMDAFMPRRDDVSYHYQAEVNEFLYQLDNAHKNQVFVVGATNNLRAIDDAIKRSGRFDVKLFIGPPDIEARIEAFKLGLKNRPYKVTNWPFLGEETENFTFSEIKFIVEQTAREASYIKKEFIDLNDLMKVVSKHKPELDDRKIQFYYNQ